MISSPLNSLSLHIPVTPPLIFSTLALIIAVWAIYTLVLRYHWKNYGTGKLEVFTMNFFYFTGSIILIVLITVSALLYLYSAT